MTDEREPLREPLEEVVNENRKLRKINRALIDRVERSVDAQGNAFSTFQAAITLEKMVHQRTGELQSLTAQLRREIAQRAEIEAALEAAKVAAERANLGKTQFLAAASHDLRQPLNVARLFLDLLAERERDAQGAQLLGRVATALDAADDLLSTLLDMSRLDAGAMAVEPADVSIGALLRRLAEEYAPQAEERDLRLRVVAGDAMVRTDGRLLERVLRNLIANALAYTKRGGILLASRTRGAVARIEVWDTGVGIPSDRLPDIFQEFKQLEHPGRTAGGMGLGLSIVERIARLLGFAVEVRSRVGRGSVFRFELPLAHAQQPASMPGTAVNAVAGKTILLIDDDRDALDGLSLLLRDWGCATIEAASAASALGACQLSQRPDFIVADYYLGRGHTGLDAIDRVREAFDAPIGALVVSGDRSEQVRARVVARGHWFLAKPVRFERLRLLLDHALA